VRPAVGSAGEADATGSHRSAQQVGDVGRREVQGLADPGGYLTQLAEATSGAWIAAEKILAPDESLPTSWPVAGTTGYDAAWRIDQLQVDPAGAARLPHLDKHCPTCANTVADDRFACGACLRRPPAYSRLLVRWQFRELVRSTIISSSLCIKLRCLLIFSVCCICSILLLKRKTSRMFSIMARCFFNFSLSFFRV